MIIFWFKKSGGAKTSLYPYSESGGTAVPFAPLLRRLCLEVHRRKYVEGSGGMSTPNVALNMFLLQ